jgi:hypothetical protein
MIVPLISTWHLGHQAREDARHDDRVSRTPPKAEERDFGLAAANRRGEASELPTAVTGSDVSSREYDQRYLMAAAESMLRAGYGQRQIERALRRMSPKAESDSGHFAAFGSLRRLLTSRGQTARRRSTQAASAGSK